MDIVKRSHQSLFGRGWFIGALAAFLFLAAGPGWAAITRVGVTSTASAGGGGVGSLNVAVPVGVLTGDVLLAQISVRGGSGTAITAPAGWTQLLLDNRGTTIRQGIYYRIASAAEPATYTFSFSVSVRAAAGMVAYRGVDVTFPVDTSSTRNNGSSTSVATTPITTNFSNDQIVGFFTTGVASNFFSITDTDATVNYVERYDTPTSAGPNGVTVMMGDSVPAKPTATSTGTVTGVATTAAVNIGALVALKPAALLRSDYHFDECAYTGAANEVLDSFGATPATPRNGLNTSQPGQVQRFGNFDTYDKWAQTSILLTSDWTLSVWFKTPFSSPLTTSQYHVLASVAGGGDLLYLDRNNNYLWGVYNLSGATDGVFQFGTLSSGWHHLVLVGRGNNTQLYIDGTLRDTIALKTTGTLTYLGTSFDSVNTTGAQGFRAPLDEFMVWDNALNTTQIASIFANQGAGNNYDGTPRPPANCLNHIRLLHDGEALTCAPETVTVQACQDAACTGLFTGSVTTTLQPAGWVGGDTITFSGGSTTAQLRRTTTGIVTLSATTTTPTPVTAARCFNGATETCSLQFFDSGFIFDVPNLTACKTSAAVTISAVRTDDVTKTCAPAFTGVKTVNFWSTYSNPATGTQSVSVNGTNVSGAIPGAGISLTFDAAAQSTFTVRYPDAGLMQLNARYTGSGADAGLIMDGNDSFVSVPVGLAVYSTNPAAACPAGDATCSAFTSAGTAFPLQVKAACWVSDADTDLSDNPATANFRLSGIALSHTLIAPAAGNLGSVGVGSFDMVAADNGISTVNQSVSEVGVFRFSATPAAGAYFGATVPGGVSTNIGRFTPHHFTLVAGATLTNRSDIAACGDSFTYMDEPFRLDYTLRAENLANALTQNYTGSFAKLSLTSAAMNYGAVSGTTNLTVRLAASGASSGSWLNGVGTVAAFYTVNRLATPDGPYPAVNVGIAPNDSDGIQLPIAALNMDVDNNTVNDHARIGLTEARFGRLRLSNAYGSEMLDLPVRMRLQYWNGTGFIDMGATDSCTSFAASDIALSFPAAATNRLAACETRVNLVGGLPGNLKLTKPGIGNDGWTNVRVNLGSVASGNTCTGAAPTVATTANKPYLRGNWTGGSYDQDPTALARFGAYRTGDGTIYFRENY